jgi:hypothetical protein
MERMAGQVRLIRMMERRFGFLGLLGVLVVAVSGCGSVVASDSAAAPALAEAATAVPAVGCASVNQANAVAIRHMLRFMAPIGKQPLATSTYRNVSEVRALFGQMCAAVTHPSKVSLVHCPADLGTIFLGTFYDGSRTLATFTYYSSGCERVSLTAAGKTLTTMVIGPAAAAAPHLATDLAAIVGEPKPGQMKPQETSGPA